MNYKYTCKTTAFDLWQLSMYYVYGSLAGVCNVIFTAAALALGISKWNQSTSLVRFFIVLACCLFPVIQPLLIYIKASKQAAAVTETPEVTLNDKGLHIRMSGRTLELSWSQVKKISKKPTMIIIFCNTTHGFVFTNKVLGDKREQFYNDAASKVKRGTTI